MTDIILLALSTLAKEKRESEFEVEDTEYKGTYIGQLEPIIKYRASLGGENDIEVLALCTEKTKNDSANHAGMSSLDYFKKRVAEIAGEENFKGTVTVTPIDISEEDPTDGIADTVDLIRQKKDLGALWVDTHGGFRDIALTLEAVMSLVKVDGIVPERIYGIRYSENRAALVDQKASFEMFDFVSGMNEFIDYGSVDQLNSYYKSHRDERLKDVLDAMNTISDGTMECNPHQYLQGLDELGKSINELEETDTMLGIFSRYIKDSYGVLLDPRKRTTVDIIRRCIEKELYQQALTILETLMPDEFVKRKILYFEPEDLEKIKKRYPWLQPKYEDDNNFVINRFVNSDFENPFFRREKPVPENLNQEREYIEILTGRQKNSKYLRSMDFLNLSKVVDSKKISLNYDKDNPIEITVKTNAGVNEWRKAGNLFRMHKALKKCRNRFNHCDSDRPLMKDIVTVMEKYADLAEELFAAIKE
ncbi:MAG: TM1812 family CRISPR-associated protein [Butyrivibrio sp.]|nr:TM1812 family CRISPR-associated protein [Butyrivibrio sp.]